MGRRQRKAFHLRQQILHTLAGLGAARHHSRKVIQPCQLADAGSQFRLVPQHVNFVNGQDHRQALLFAHCQQFLLLVVELALRLHHKQASIHAAYRVAYRLVHMLAQLVVGMVKTGGVRKHQLHLVPSQHAHDLGTGGLWLRRHNGDLAAGKSVQNRRFAHIGLADNGDKCRSGHDSSPM